MRADSGGPLELDIEGATATLTLDRPGRRNVLDADLLTALHRSLDVVHRSPTVRVLRLGHHGPWFCAGMDLADVAEPVRTTADFYSVLERLALGDLTTIAIVDGQVAGGGVGLVAACDVVLASAGSTFSLPEALWGLVPAAVYPFLRRRVGPGGARHLALSTRTMTAPEAARMGLVDEVSERVDQAATAATRRCVRVDRATIARIKAYTNSFDALPAHGGAEAAAVLTAAVRAPGVVDRIDKWTRTGRLPWE
ncbi:enoyl-CoA hydratase/isomerase family protein [Nocardia sp. NPDC059177]|uniref:enoyl-CoA hydratase/isomerase family protein n=1 Tax=Nocardia sp. NPDC059177 TaxID=3346759 RepID=UPI0036B0F48F